MAENDIEAVAREADSIGGQIDRARREKWSIGDDVLDAWSRDMARLAARLRAAAPPAAGLPEGVDLDALGRELWKLARITLRGIGPLKSAEEVTRLLHAALARPAAREGSV